MIGEIGKLLFTDSLPKNRTKSWFINNNSQCLTNDKQILLKTTQVHNSLRSIGQLLW